jgi:hypothetical protein
MEMITTAPSATLTVAGVSIPSVSLMQGGNGYLSGTVYSYALQRVLTSRFAMMQSSTASRVMTVTLTPGAPPVEVVGTLQPVDGGGYTIRAFQITQGLCDPSALQEQLTEEEAQKSSLENQLITLQDSLYGAELADVTVCSAAFTNAVNSLTWQIAAAGLLGDLALAAELTAELYTLKHTPFVCDPAGVANLTSVLQSTESELALAELAISATLQELSACK